MVTSFLITLREGLEASLIIAILLTYLTKTNRRHEAKYVWMGTAAAIVACLIAGTLIYVLVDGLHGNSKYAVEGVIALAAASVLTHMIFWMRKNSQNLSAELREKIDRSAKTAVLIIAFVAVVREGLETALFLLSAETESASGSSVVIGGLIGLAVSVVLGYAVFAGGRKVNLKAFFTITAVLLLLFAAGLAGKFVHEFRELIVGDVQAGDSWFVQPAWSIDSGIWAKGTFYDFMRGLFGWHREAENIRVITYFAYLLPVMYLYFRKPANATK